MPASTATVVLYQLDHLSARFRYEGPSSVVVGPGIEMQVTEQHDVLGLDLPLRQWVRAGRPATLTLTIDTTPASAEPDWAVGHEFTGDRTGTCTSDSHPDGGGFSCVRPRDHVGKHLATSPGGIVIATWDS